MSRLDLPFYLTLLLIFTVSVVNLNYNTPFNDEAVYVVIGRLGLFAKDWFTYGAGFWMAGLHYVYPTLTTLAYQVGGIAGSRLLNVIFGILAVEEVYRLTRQLRLFDTATNQLAGIIAAALVGLSTAGLYVARLATYDMPCFLLLLLAVNSFLKASGFNHGKYYFLSALFLFAAFLTKIIAAVFFPPLLLLSFIVIRTRDSLHRSLYIKYFIIPLGLFLTAYASIFLQYFVSFAFNHIDQGTEGTIGDIISVIWSTTYPIIILSVILTPILVIAKKIRPVLTLLALSLVIPAFHLLLNRVPTLNKHLYLTVVFLSVIAGYGLSWLTRYTQMRLVAKLSIPLVILAYFIFSRPEILRLEQSWQNTTDISRYLSGTVVPGNRILLENGAALVLSLYDKLYPPTQTTTFDWIDYSGFQGQSGYIHAIEDQYFDYIELDSQHNNSRLHELIRFRLIAKYSLIHRQDGFEIYAKIN